MDKILQSEARPSKRLIIGGQSLIGRALITALLADGHQLISTTRRRDLVSPGVHFLDLAEENVSLPDIECDIAYVVAGVSRFADCAQDPARTWITNVDNLFKICEALLAKGAFLVYLSSSAVFDGTVAYAGEGIPVTPTTEYGRQKAALESELLELGTRLPGKTAIVRLTKLVSAQNPLFGGWMDAIICGKPISAFSNAKLSPVSMQFLLNFVRQIVKEFKPGIFHCTGSEDVSYADFCRSLCAVLGQPAELVIARDAALDEMLYRAQHSSLGTEGTENILGIGSQLLQEAVTDLVKEYRCQHEAGRAGTISTIS